MGEARLSEKVINHQTARCYGPGYYIYRAFHNVLRSCHTRVNMLTSVWQQLEYRIDVCRVTRGAHIEHL